MQDDTRETCPAVGGFLHDAFGVVNVSEDDDSRVGAQMEIPELMAGG
jgi:hypothetical protein